MRSPTQLSLEWGKQINNLTIDMPPKITKEYLASQGLSADFPRRFWAKVHKTDHCWIWTADRPWGEYGRIQTGVNRRAVMAHRASWILNRGPIPVGKLVLHNCTPLRDNPACVNPEHLWLGTNLDNSRDAFAKGTWHPLKALPGEDNLQAKLTREQVEEIRRIYASGGITMRELAKIYGVCAPNICDIIHHKRWA